MLTLFAAVLALPQPAAPQATAPRPPVARRDVARTCRPGAQVVVGGPEIRARKLGEMPPASAYAAVYNEVDRCPQPIVLREGIGADTAPRPRSRTAR